MLHRSRQLLFRQRTMLSNAIRGHWAEIHAARFGNHVAAVELIERGADWFGDFKVVGSPTCDGEDRPSASATPSVQRNVRWHSWFPAAAAPRTAHESPAADEGRNPDAVLAEIAAMNAKPDTLGLVLELRRAFKAKATLN